MTIYTLFLYIGIIALVLTLMLGIGHAKLMKYAKMKPVLWFLQYFVGCLLIFSGLVKAVDPLGTAYKMADYFTLLLPVLSFMKPFALPFALFMIVLEIVLGINLILGHGKGWTTGLSFLMMLFFTFLTGYNYYTGYLPENVGFFEFGKWQAFKETSIRVSDCGCFGDFMKLLPIETFMKDVLLTGITLYMLLKTNDLKFIIPTDAKLGAIPVRGSMTTLFSIAVTVFCFMNFYFGLPMVDFRPFREGTNIPLAISECKLDEPLKKITFWYKNSETGQTKLVRADEITQEKFKFLWDDKDGKGNKVWVIQSDKTKEELIKKGCDSKIKEMDNKQSVFASNGYALWIVADGIDPFYSSVWKKIRVLTDEARKDGVEATALYHHIADKNQNGDQTDDLEAFRHEISLAFDFIQSDEKLVKTIIRSSPGLILLHNGTVVKMWHHRQLPNWEQIKKEFIKKTEPELEMTVNIEAYTPGTTLHKFKCRIEKVEKGQLSAQNFELNVMDGNNLLLSKLVDKETAQAFSGPIKMTFNKRPDLVSKNKKVEFTPNGFLDSSRNAWIVADVKK